MLIAGAALVLTGSDPESVLGAAAGSFVRIGLVLGAIWLALPQLQRIPLWFGQLLLVGAIAIAARPKLAVVVAPLILAIWFLRPRTKSRSKKSS